MLKVVKFIFILKRPKIFANVRLNVFKRLSDGDHEFFGEVFHHVLVGELGFTGKLKIREGFSRIILLTKDTLVFNQILTLENFIIIS